MGDAQPTLLELVDALLLFNEPILNHRFHEMVAREPRGGARRTRLDELPPRIVGAQVAAREGAVAWQRLRGGPRLDARFLAVGQRALLEAFQDLTESQVRMFTLMAREAPTQEVRDRFDTAAGETRAVLHVLRDIVEEVARASRGIDADGPVPNSARPVQEEIVPPGDLRGQVEAAIRRFRAAGKEPRRLLLSHTAVRHLRDQACFRNGEVDVLGVEAFVDLGWDAPAFALETYDVVPLEEMR